MEPTTTAAPTNPPLRDTYLTDQQLAMELPKCTVRMLRTWRNLRVGPPWLKVGRQIVYLRASVERWLQKNELVISREQRSARAARRRAR
jgi:hypothetical protein